MKIKINVTKEIIQESMLCGIVNEVSKNCAVANAVRDLFPMAVVNHHSIYFNGYKKVGFMNYEFEPGTRSQYLSADVLRWIRQFDGSTPNERLTLNEISFEIEVPDLVIERISINQVNEILSNSSTLERV